MNAADEIDDEDSIYNYYRQLLQLKRQAPFTDGQFIMLGSNDQLFTYLIDDGTEQAAIICNLSSEMQRYTLPFAGDATLLAQGGASCTERQVTLPAWSSIVVSPRTTVSA